MFVRAAAEPVPAALACRSANHKQSKQGAGELMKVTRREKDLRFGGRLAGWFSFLSLWRRGGRAGGRAGGSVGMRASGRLCWGTCGQTVQECSRTGLSRRPKTGIPGSGKSRRNGRGGPCSEASAEVTRCPFSLRLQSLRMLLVFAGADAETLLLTFLTLVELTVDRKELAVVGLPRRFLRSWEAQGGRVGLWPGPKSVGTGQRGFSRGSRGCVCLQRRCSGVGWAAARGRASGRWHFTATSAVVGSSSRRTRTMWVA